MLAFMFIHDSQDFCRGLVEVVGRTNKVREQFYALSLERKISDALPILSTIYNTAKTQLFAETDS